MSGKYKQNSKRLSRVIHGLWGLQVGNASFGGKNALVFSSGPKGYAKGLVGTLKPAA